MLKRKLFYDISLKLLWRHWNIHRISFVHWLLTSTLSDRCMICFWNWKADICKNLGHLVMSAILKFDISLVHNLCMFNDCKYESTSELVDLGSSYYAAAQVFLLCLKQKPIKILKKNDRWLKKDYSNITPVITKVFKQTF